MVESKYLTAESVRSVIALVVVIGGLIFSAVFLLEWSGNTPSLAVLSTVTGLIGIVLGFYFGTKATDQAQTAAESAKKTADDARAVAATAQKNADQSHASAKAANDLIGVAQEAARTNAVKYAKLADQSAKFADWAETSLKDLHKQFADSIGGATPESASLFDKLTGKEKNSLQGLHKSVEQTSAEFRKKRNELQELLNG